MTLHSRSDASNSLAVQERSLFVLPKEHRHLLATGEVQKMDKFAKGTRHFLANYDRASELMGKSADQRVRRLSGQSAPPKECAEMLQGSIRDLGTKLLLDAKQSGRDFCLTLCEYQKLCTGQYYRALDTLFSIGDEPVPLDEFAQILPFNDITQAVLRMGQTSKSSIWLADCFLGNIYAMQSITGTLKAQCEHLERLQTHIDNCDEKILNHRTQQRECMAQREQAAADEKVMMDVQQKKAGAEEYYKQQLAACEEKLKTSEQQEQDYQYRCYGPYEWVWKNDVKLAKEKVQRFTKEIEVLRQKLATVTTRNNDDMLKDCSMNLTKKAVEAAGNMKQHEDAITALQSNKGELQAEHDLTMNKVAYLINQNGATSVDHLLDSMQALKDVGKSSSRMADGGEVVLAGWMRDLQFIGVIMQRMCRGKTKEEQMKAFSALKNFTSKPENKLCQLLTHVDPVIEFGDACMAELSPPAKRRRLMLYGACQKPTQEFIDSLKVTNMPRLQDVPDQIQPMDQADVAQRAQQIQQSDQPLEVSVPMTSTTLDSDGDRVAESDNAFVDDMSGAF